MEYKTLEQAVKENPGIGRRRLMALTGRTGWACEKFLEGIRKGCPAAEGPIDNLYRRTTSDGRVPYTDRSGIPVKEFMGRFDYESKLRKTVKALCRGCFVSEHDIRSNCGIPIPSFKAVAEMPEFKKCQVKDEGVTWWGTAENVAAVRAEARKWGVQK